MANEWVRAWRGERTQPQCAKLLKMSVRQYRDFENGKTDNEGVLYRNEMTIAALDEGLTGYKGKKNA